MPNKKCNPICAPFVIYVILSVISLLGTIFSDSEQGSKKVMTVGLNVLGMSLFGSLYYYLCSICKKTTAWVILLLPVIVYVIVFLTAVGLLTSAATSSQNKGQNS
jgi:hypothetical protein